MTEPSPDKVQRRQGVCPVCLRMRRTDNARSSIIRCDCGASLFISPTGRLLATIEQQAPTFESPASEADGNHSGHQPAPEDDSEPVATGFPNVAPQQDSTSEGNDKAETISNVNEESASNREDANPKKLAASKRKSWPAIYIVAAVVILLMLVAGIVIRLTRKREKDPTSVPATVSKPPTMEEIAGKIEVAPGTILQLVSQVPSPEPIGWTIVENANDPTDVPSNRTAPSASPDSRAAVGGPTLSPSLQLPARAQSRTRVPILSANADGGAISDYEDIRDRAYESYETFIALGEKDIESKAYRDQLAETLQAFKQAYASSFRQEDLKQQDDSKRREDLKRRDELVYLLAFLSLKAGHVIEAAIYGEFAATHGDSSEGATRDSAFIALAAIQEASSIHWGLASEVGELHQMRAIATLIDSRWPDEPQRDAIWLNLAQRYTAFGKHLEAIDAFQNISEKSDQYVEAQLGIGFAYWRSFLAEAAENNKPDDLADRLQQASKHLAKGVSVREKAAKTPDLPILSAKLTLAMIARRVNDREAIERWLTQGKFPLIDSITTQKQHQPSQIVVSETFTKQVFDTLYQFRMDAGDTTGAKQALSLLATALGQEQTVDVSNKYMPMLKLQFKKLLEMRSASEDEIASLESLNDAVETNQAADSVNDQLWIAKSWAHIAQVADNKSLVSDCYRRAASISGRVVQRDDFPESLFMGTKKQQSIWLQQAGSLEESFAIVTEMLDRSPNAIEMQLQTALMMEQIAIAGDSASELLNAITGTRTDGSESPTWGWAKLTKNLHRLRFSSEGNDAHARLLLHSHFHLARCRWLLASTASDRSHREMLMNQIKKQFATLNVLNSEDDASKEWRDAFTKLRSVTP